MWIISKNSKLLFVRIAAALSTAVACASLSASNQQKDVLILYVESHGDDAWSGSLKKSTDNKTDGPLRTLEGARDRIRQLKKEGKFTKPIEVRIGSIALGFRPEPFLLFPEDSGSESQPIRYVGAEDSKEPTRDASFDGTSYVGGSLYKLTETTKGKWNVIIPASARGSNAPEQLFINGRRRSRARLPKQGYYKIADAAKPTGKFGARPDQFIYSPGDIKKDWYDLNAIEVVATHVWATSRLRINNIDDAARTVTFTGAASTDQSWSAMPKGNRYYIENVREALSAPEEWYVDRATGSLDYISSPRDGNHGIMAIIPNAESFIELRGNTNKREWVSNIHFENIAFHCSAWRNPPEGYSFPQAEIVLPAAVRVTGARNCSFTRVDVGRTGAWALELGAGCKNNIIQDCNFNDLGAGGVKIGEASIRDDEDLVASHNTIKNCKIINGGRIHPAAVGVWIGQSHDNIIENNEIGDFYYTGVSVGWTWGYGRHNAHHNQIINNHIYNIGQGVLSDMGGIYTLGVQPGTVLRGNRIHDIESFGYGGWGIYTDEGSTGILIENNIIYKTKSAGFHQHYGKENIVRNNIFAFGREFQIMRTRAEAHLSFTFENNIIYFSEGQLLGGNWDGENYKFDHNTYWRAGGDKIKFTNKSFDAWRKSGQDANSRIENPKFKNPTAGDFTRESK